MLAQPTKSRSEDHRSEGAAPGTILERVLRTSEGHLRRVARLNSPPGEAEDALHDAFESFLRHFDPSVDPDPDYAVRWLTTTVKRAGWARSRRGAGRATHQIASALDGNCEPDNAMERLEDLGADVSDAALRREACRQFRAQFARLKCDERRALSLLAVGFRYAEIQRLTGWSYTKLNRCLSEGRTKLREVRRER